MDGKASRGILKTENREIRNRENADQYTRSVILSRAKDPSGRRVYVLSLGSFAWLRMTVTWFCFHHPCYSCNPWLKGSDDSGVFKNPGSKWPLTSAAFPPLTLKCSS